MMSTLENASATAPTTKPPSSQPSAESIQNLLAILQQLPSRSKKHHSNKSNKGNKSKRTKHKKGKKSRDGRRLSPSSDSSSSSSSSSDSDDHASRRRCRRQHDAETESNSLARPLAQKFISNALRSAGRSGLIADIYKKLNFKDERNGRECYALAKVIDAIRQKDYSSALELLVRRLVGVQSADTSGNWALCDAFELVMDKQSFVPDDILALALQRTQRLESLADSVSEDESMESRNI